MQTINLTQGTPEWHTHRLTHWNASDAPAMLAQSSHKSRTALLHEYVTGIKPECTAFTQKMFDQGHRFEALARQHIAQGIVGEVLYPCVGVSGKLSASFDGLTMDERVCFEHKMLNQILKACRSIEDVPIEYKIQMQQQLMVSQASRCLFVASEWDQADQLIDKVVFWYESDSKLAKQISDGWQQFEQDLASYMPTTGANVTHTTEILALPALNLEVIGTVKSSNLQTYQQAAETFIATINTNLQTDDDFAQAEKSVKFCKEAEDKLAMSKSAVLAQTGSIDELMRTIDHISASLRNKRLTLERLIKSQKDMIKTNLIMQNQQAFNAHVFDLNAQLAGAALATIPTHFAEVIKGKKSSESMRSALSDELARLKIQANRQAQTVQTNLEYLADFNEFRFLFGDLNVIANKACDDFAALVTVRIAAHKEAMAMKSAIEHVQQVSSTYFEQETPCAPTRPHTTHVVDLSAPRAELPAHVQEELRLLVQFAHAHGYDRDTAELEYLFGGL
ncbi:YqaJ viral recombinase family protein [Hydromonas duriensis]|uniref:Putative phage-type endonuclease n=1 Tax=Hydromonas duriensis TaxID=1527608 RepID=A0A4R6Y5H1_9BURK|nr:YqaJ viral recombinase family protein [Hydromonas duriensis]TDR30658.1 putative phage-type endonuclease [Hydromonas duriensis]